LTISAERSRCIAHEQLYLVDRPFQGEVCLFFEAVRLLSGFEPSPTVRRATTSLDQALRFSMSSALLPAAFGLSGALCMATIRDPVIRSNAQVRAASTLQIELNPIAGRLSLGHMRGLLLQRSLGPRKPQRAQRG
jgi:hypothetical protein